MNIFEAQRILGLFGRYDERLLKKQYRIMTRKYHPDNCELNGISIEEADKKIREINEANDLLSKECKKCNSNNTNNYQYRSSNNKTYDERYINLNKVILDNLESKINLNKKAFAEFERLMKKYSAETVLERYKILEWDLKYYYNRFSLSDFGSYQKLENEYQKCILKYGEHLLDMYDDFYDNYLKDHILYKVKKGHLYYHLLNNRIKNRNFSLISDLVSLINMDLDNLMNVMEGELLNEYLYKVSIIIHNYKIDILPHFSSKGDNLEDKTVNFIKETIRNKKRDFYSFSLEINNELDNILKGLIDYLKFLEKRFVTIKKLYDRLDKKSLSSKKANEIRMLLVNLENEYNEQKFNQLEVLILSRMDETLIESVLKKIKTNINKINYNDSNALDDEKDIKVKKRIKK